MHGSARARTGTEGPPPGPRYRKHLAEQPQGIRRDGSADALAATFDPFSSGSDGPGSSPADLERAARALGPFGDGPNDGESVDPFALGSDDTERTAGRDEQPDTVGYGPWFEAQYEGECAGCWCALDPGDRIRADGEGGYLCDQCGED